MFLRRIAFQEVATTEFGEDRFGLGQEVLDHNQDGIGDHDRGARRHDGLAGDGIASRDKYPWPGRGPGGFDQGGAHPFFMRSGAEPGTKKLPKNSQGEMI